MTTWGGGGAGEMKWATLDCGYALGIPRGYALGISHSIYMLKDISTLSTHGKL